MSIGTNAYARSCQCRNCILDEWSRRSDHFLWYEPLLDVQLVSFLLLFDFHFEGPEMALTGFRNLVASLCIRRMGYSSISTLSQLLLLFSLLSLIALVLGIMGGVTSELWEGWGKKLANRWRQGILVTHRSHRFHLAHLSLLSGFWTLPFFLASTLCFDHYFRLPLQKTRRSPVWLLFFCWWDANKRRYLHTSWSCVSLITSLPPQECLILFNVLSSSPINLFLG